MGRKRALSHPRSRHQSDYRYSLKLNGAFVVPLCSLPTHESPPPPGYNLGMRNDTLKLLVGSNVKKAVERVRSVSGVQDV